MGPGNRIKVITHTTSHIHALVVSRVTLLTMHWLFANLFTKYDNAYAYRNW